MRCNFHIRNFSSNAPAYMQDNNDPNSYIRCGGEVNDNSYWTFEKTSKSNCYNVKNTATNRYIQGYTTQTEQPVLLGVEKAEYYVVAPSAEGGRYGFAFTGNAPYDFTSGTIGLNLKSESNQTDCWVQTYAAANGTNHRSFWTLDEVSIPTMLGIIQAGNKIESNIFDIQGRRLKKVTHPGIYIVDGKKVMK